MLHSKPIDKTLSSVVTRNDLERWKTKFDEITAAVNRQKDELQENQNRLNIAVSMLKQLENERIVPMEGIITALTARIDILTQPAHLTREWQRLEQQLKTKVTNLLPFSIGLSTQTDVSQLNAVLEQQKENKKILQQEKKQRETVIAQLRQTITVSQTTIQNLQLQIRFLRSNQFLYALSYSPDKLTNALIDSIQQTLANYEKKYPAHQHPNVRICLIEAKEKIAHIRTAVTSPLEHYYQLCGLLWTLLNNVDVRTGKNAILAEGLMAIIRRNQLDSTEALEAYHALQQSENTLLAFRNTVDLISYETKAYEDARAALDNAITEARNKGRNELANKAKALAAAIQRERIALTQLKEQNGDKKLIILF